MVYFAISNSSVSDNGQTMLFSVHIEYSIFQYIEASLFVDLR